MVKATKSNPRATIKANTKLARALARSSAALARVRSVRAPARVRRIASRSRDVFSNITRNLVGSLNEPTTVMFIAIAMFVSVDYTHNPSDNIITKLAALAGTNTVVGKFLTSHAKNFVGMLIVLPGALSAPRSQRTIVALCAMGVLASLHTLHYYTYIMLGVGLRLFFRTRDSQTRVFLLLILGAAAALATRTAAADASGSATTTTTTPAPRG